MGITKEDSKFLFYSKTLGVSFDKTLTLGRQYLYVTKPEINEQISKFKNVDLSPDSVDFLDEYCEPLLKILGSNHTDSMDFSAYEKATIIHDLNTPVAANLKNKFSVVLDSGTLEHIFDFKTAVKNCMEMVEIGGHFIGITPVNNLMGHGFYQFTPELLFSVFSSQNGFQMVKMIIAACDENGKFYQWYEVANPAVIGSRLHLVNEHPTYVMYVAKKIAEVNIFETLPQQSDYVTTWKIHDVIQNNAASEESKLKTFYRKRTPAFIKHSLYKLRKFFSKRQVVTADLGKIDPTHFKKMDV